MQVRRHLIRGCRPGRSAIAVFTASVITAAGSTLPAGAAPASSTTVNPAAPRLTAPTRGGLPLTLETTSVLPGGDVATTWVNAAGTVVARAAGPAGSYVVAPPVETTTSGGVTTYSSRAELVVPEPPAGANLASTVASEAQQYAASGRSVYWDAIGAGASPTVAAEMAAEDGIPVPSAAPPEAHAADKVQTDLVPPANVSEFSAR